MTSIILDFDPGHLFTCINKCYVTYSVALEKMNQFTKE